MRFNTSFLTVLSLSLFLMGSALPFSVAQDETPTIHVYNVWSRPAMEGMEVGAAYLQIENPGETDLALISAVAPVAETIEIHEMKMEGDVMQMSPVERIDIPAGETVALEPGGYHVMLIGVEETLEAGQAFPLTLTFDIGGDETLEIVTAALVSEEPPAERDLVIYDGWARAAIGGESAVSAAYMTIENRGEEAERLIGMTSDAAEAAEIHETKMEGDLMQMSPVEGVDILPGMENMVEFAPGGYHIMLISLPEDLAVDQAIVVTLTFESGLEIPLALPVLDATMMEDDTHSH